LKNKRFFHDKDYRQLRNILFTRTAILAVCAVALIFLIYSLALEGRFADGMVWLIDLFLPGGYDAALNIYQNYIRNYMDFFILAAFLLVFLILVRLYLNWFTRYFQEINRGFDALLGEEASEVVLSPELHATEKKINAILRRLEKRRAEAERAEQRKNDLIVYLAHDLKTPLTSVIGYLTLLRDEPDLSPERRERYLSIALDKSERLEELINEFFEITRFNLSHIELQRGRVNLTRMLEQIAFEFGPMLKEKDLRCTLDLQPNLALMGDANKLQRVFDNLLRNAVLYSDAGSEVKITAQTAGEERVLIRFQNKGDTIPEEKLGRIFEQFYRLDAARGTNAGGAGLGLAIAKQIVEAHGGEIKAESREEITAFVVSLPLS
jgi:two-component system sensor histidine kinase VanS